MSDSKDDFNRLRGQFSRRANAREIPALASKLCWWIAYGRMDIKRRSTYVTQRTLAGDLGGVAVRTVQRMIEVLKPLGLNVAPGHGPDKASTYWIGEANTTSMSPIEADNTTSMSPIEEANTTSMLPIQPGQGDIGVGSTRHFERRKATLVSRHIKNSKKISKKVSKKSPGGPPPGHTSRADRDSANDSAAVDAPLNRAFTTIDDAPVPEPLTPVPRPVGRPDTVEAQNPSPPSIASKAIGGPAANGRVSPNVTPFARVLSVYPMDRIANEGKAFSVFKRTLAAMGGDLDAVLDALDILMQERGPNFPDLADALAEIAARHAGPDYPDPT